MAVCLIVEQQMSPLQLKLNTAPLQNMKAPKLKVMQNKSYHGKKKEAQEEDMDFFASFHLLLLHCHKPTGNKVLHWINGSWELMFYSYTKFLSFYTYPCTPL